MISQIPDRVSTLDLSKLWLLKALEQFPVAVPQEADEEQIEEQVESEE